MDTEAPQRGWTVGRVLGLIVAIVAMAGLGFASSCGVILAVVLPSPSPWLIVGVVGGVILFLLFLRFAVAINRRVDGRTGDRT